MTNFTNNFELNKAHHDSFFKKASDNDIEKSGEGSKGGTVIGHTSTGKPIYAHRPYEHHSKEELHKLADKKAGRDRMNAINELSLRYEQVSGKKASSLALDRKEPFITKPESNIEKGGEGSRGGKIIGHTKSGKAIYDTASHESHKDFTPEDHNDAYKIHHDQMFDDRDRTQHHRTQRDVHSSQSDLKSKKAYEEKLATRKIAEKNKVEIDKLNKERKQLLIDMEQEAEPEGGSIADMYGRKLDRIDNKIDKLKGIKKSEDTDSLQKAFEVLGLPDAYDQIEKGGKPALVGEIRDFGGKKMIKTKMGSNSWRPYFPGGKHEHLTSGDKKEPAKEEVKTEPRAEKKEPESDKEKSPSFGKTQSGKEIRLVKEEDFKKEHNSFSEQDHKEAADMLKRSMDKRQAKYDASRSEEFPEQKQHREENRQMKQHLSNLKTPQPLTETELAYLRSYKKQIDEGKGHQLAPHEVQKWGDRFKQQYGIDFKEAAYGKK